MTLRTTRYLSLLAACAGLQLASCAPGDDESFEDDVLAQQAGGSMAMPDAGGMAMGDGGMAMGDGGMMMDATCRADHPAFTPNMTQKFGDITVKVLSADPEPPRQQAPNDWVIQLLDASGQPLAGAKLLHANTFMGVHGHFGTFTPAVVELASPGQFKLESLDFTMRGPWEVLFDVTPAGATASQRVTFNICVE